MQIARDAEARLALVLRAREPKVLRMIGEESKRRGTSKLSSRQIDRIINDARKE